MAASTRRASGSRASSPGKSSSSRSRSGSSSSSGARTRQRSSSANGSRPRQGTNSRQGANQAKRTSQAKSNGAAPPRNTLVHVAIPAVTGAVGVAGGILLGRNALQRSRKVLGVPLPGVKVDLADVSKHIGEAARQFGRLAREVQATREKAERIGRAIS